MADKTTGALQEAPIGQLPAMPDIYDDALIPVEFQGEARHISGWQWTRYAQASTLAYVEGAKESAAAAENSAKEAADSAATAAGSASDAAESAETAQQYSGKPPTIIDGRWWIWNAATQEYEDTGEAARGNLMYATFFLDPRSGELYMFADNEYAGPEFRLNGPDLEVVLNAGN